MSNQALDFIPAQWSAPTQIHAVTTTRCGGYSEEVYAGLNLGDHVGDRQQVVEQNRVALLKQLGLEKSPQWLQQVHGTAVVYAEGAEVIEADACWTDQKGLACIVMTADCLPVFFSDLKGERVAVAHAGWRGLLSGVLEKTLKVFPDPTQVVAWLGPAIGPQSFEVGEEVFEQFVSVDPVAVDAFVMSSENNEKYFADLYLLAKQRLLAQGVREVTGCDLCTYQDEERFFSYRRDGQTGRMASLIWIGE